jgi:DICT domain-containing protein/predicted DNA-binding transcriptional regulator AlpA
MPTPDADAQVHASDLSEMPSTNSSTEGAALSIGDLADRTGISPATLRMWESRHGFPKPQRLGSGHRRYSEEDVSTIERVVQHKDAGTRLEQAIRRAMADAQPAAPSVYAHLRRRHPGIGVHRLKKTTLLGLSWAMEDEFCAKADRASIYGAFQRERYYRKAQPRWTELARVARSATVLADFAEDDLDASPVEVRLHPDAPMRREWAVVCDAPDLPMVLTAWELPGQSDVSDRDRLFESMWTVEATAVHDAARVCAAVAGVEAPPETNPPGSSADPQAVTALFNRVISYVDRLS